MARGSLIHTDWLATIEQLGGAAHLEAEARDFGAFRRAREVRSAVDLLRLTLAYCLGSMGLRLTAGWAEACGLATLSNVALLKRLRRTAPWLEVLVGRLLAADRPAAARPSGRPIRIVDATVVARRGAEARESGGVWHVHAVYDLPSERFSTFELTDEREGERIDRAAVVPGEIRIADRAYLQPDRIARVLAGKGDVIVRAPWNGARWFDGEGRRLDLVVVLKKARRKGVLDHPIWMGGATSRVPLALRLVAIRKPKAAIAETIARLKRKASKKGQSLQPETLIAAEWLILVTSLDAQSFPLPTIADLYRTRWRIEIAFKQLKSAAGLVRPPGEDPDVAKAHILSHLLLILLTEPLLAEHLGVSPRRKAA
jgi:hypothetical protein